jgi:membrane protein DedA with SNARE-associated domain
VGMPDWLTNLLIRYGYVFVFAGVFLESTGLPISGETALLAGAFFAQQGYFSLPWIIGVGIAGGSWVITWATISVIVAGDPWPSATDLAWG